MKGNNLSPYTTAPLSEYIGSHIYGILGIDVHETLLGIRRNKLVVTCKDFQKHMGDLGEVRTIKNTAIDAVEELNKGDSSQSVTGDVVDLQELFSHFQVNPLLKSTNVQKRFWISAIVDKMRTHTRDFSRELAVPILLCRNNK